MSSPVAKHPGGRPSRYKPEYCEAVVEYMSQGYSLTAFAGSIRVSRETIYNWTREHPEFLDATKSGQAARTDFLEKRLLSAEIGPQVTSAIFALKNSSPADWRDRVETASTTVVEHRLKLEVMDSDALADLGALLMIAEQTENEPVN